MTTAKVSKNTMDENDYIDAVVFVGLPATGKSTFREDFLKDHPNAFVYSTDDMIEFYAKVVHSTYDKVFSEKIKEATNSCDTYLKYVMEKQGLVVWDQTNLTVKKRKNIISKLKSNGYKNIQCIHFLPPNSDSQKEEWRNRLTFRKGKTIPNHILESMLSHYEYPKEEEGFVEILEARSFNA